MPTPAQGRQPLTEYLREQLHVDRELNRVLELAARQSASFVRQLELREGTSIGARVRAAQLRAVLAELTRVQSDTWTTGIGPIIRRSYPRAAAAAERSFSLLEEVVKLALGVRAAEGLISSFRQTARAGLELDRARRAQALSPRVYKNSALASGAVERQIRAGIIQGLSARELARNVRQYISPTTPGGVSYAAQRLARTELNNAFHEAQKIQGEAPWVAAVVWNLSKSHPAAKGTGKPDECDRFSTQDIYDMGKGRYPADRVPNKPHPQCLCFTTYDTISESEMLDLLPGLLDAGQRIA